MELLYKDIGDTAHSVLNFFVREALRDIEVRTVINVGNVVAKASVHMFVDSVIAYVNLPIWIPLVERSL
jgi:hypothetical protein